MVKSPVVLVVKRCRLGPWVGKIPWRRKWQPTPIFLPGKSHGHENPGGLQSVGSQRIRRDSVTEYTLNEGGGKGQRPKNWVCCLRESRLL